MKISIGEGVNCGAKSPRGCSPSPWGVDEWSEAKNERRSEKESSLGVPLGALLGEVATS